jgi:hypothetical protein
MYKVKFIQDIGDNKKDEIKILNERQYLFLKSYVMLLEYKPKNKIVTKENLIAKC